MAEREREDTEVPPEPAEAVPEEAEVEAGSGGEVAVEGEGPAYRNEPRHMDRHAFSLLYASGCASVGSYHCICPGSVHAHILTTVHTLANLSFGW